MSAFVKCWHTTALQCAKKGILKMALSDHTLKANEISFWNFTVYHGKNATHTSTVKN